MSFYFFMKIKNLVLASAVAISFSACVSSSNYVNSIGKEGLELNKNMKQGSSCIWLGVFGSATIKAAAEDGNITNVKYAESSFNPIRACQVVYGY